MFFSIIIPLYNSEKTIYYTLLSALKQDFKDFEIIVIDDGSTDQSKQIVENFIYEFKRTSINLISQQNSGVAAARIKGIENAKGDFLLFLDSDDAISSNCLSYLYQIIKEKNPDVINFKYRKVSSINCIPDLNINNIESSLLTDKNKIAEVLFESSGNNSLCNKAFRRNLFDIKVLKNTIGIVNGEDRICNVLVFPKINSLYITNLVLYYYLYVYFESKHSSKLNSNVLSDCDLLFENVIKNINDFFVINKIRTHEIDKLLSSIKKKIKYEKLSFKNYKIMIRNFKKTVSYIEFLSFGYSSEAKTEKFYKHIFKLIQKNKYVRSFVFLKMMSYRRKK